MELNQTQSLLGLMGEAPRETNTVGQVLPKEADQVGRRVLPPIPIVHRCLLEQFLWVKPCSRCWGHSNEQNGKRVQSPGADSIVGRSSAW